MKWNFSNNIITDGVPDINQKNFEDNFKINWLR